MTAQKSQINYQVGITENKRLLKCRGEGSLEKGGKKVEKGRKTEIRCQLEQ